MHTHNGTGQGMFFIVAIFFAVALAVMEGCSPQGDSTLGNGKVDLVEAATIRVAVGMAFTARPDTVVPAYRVATGLLVVLDADATHSQAALAKTIKTSLTEETAKLHLDAATASAFTDLVGLVEAQLLQQLKTPEVSTSQKAVVLRDVLTIVRDAAADRMGAGSTGLA